jgi:hypothetical protein
MALSLPDVYVAEEVSRHLEEQVEANLAEAQYWNRELRKIDPGLSIVFGRESADDPWVSPGRWMIQKEVPGQEPLLIPWEHPDGSFRPLSSAVLDFIQEADMWNERNRKERRERQERLREAKRRQVAREAEQREDELRLSIRAGARLRGDGGLVTNTQPKREGKGLKKA